ncbi:hypothetical protein [Bradyrhizobium sp. dw_78]|uniref:hypothetical protein n=1 Tax=Bradyrhizobium sp. dw_78 TaxID=2719793 RepID=UPI001BD502AF|nr:hypothetical protein [Bradyrhizobium sp. dw_78]
MRNFRLFLLFTTTALLALAVSPFLFWAPKVLACRVDFDPSTFLAYCNGNGYGDYEHGALFWNLEPDAVKSLRAARILFLGNSRVQFAFSTDATRAYFRDKNIPYYLAGFTYYENMMFMLRLMDKYRLHPDAVVINSDTTFFDEKLMSTPAAMFRPRTELLFWTTFYGYLLKGGFTRIVRPICSQLPFVCSETLQTLWRKRETGEWMWRDTFAEANRSLPINPAARSPAPDESAMQDYEKAAQLFIGSLGLPRHCIILTAIPNSLTTDEPIADRLGARLQLPVIIPHVNDLATIDNSHLNGPSADRWSDAFLRESAPALDRCLAESNNQTGGRN